MNEEVSIMGSSRSLNTYLRVQRGSAAHSSLGTVMLEIQLCGGVSVR